MFWPESETRGPAKRPGGERPLSIHELLNHESSDDDQPTSVVLGSQVRLTDLPPIPPLRGHGGGAAKPGHQGGGGDAAAGLPRQQFLLVGDPSQYPRYAPIYSPNVPAYQGPSCQGSSCQGPSASSTSSSASPPAVNSVRPLVARSTDLGDGRYRPYPEILSAANTFPTTGNRPSLSRAVNTAMDIQQRRKEAMTQQQQQRRQQLKRRRRTQACEYCHMKKVKCEGDGVRCLNCMRNDVQCVWGQKRKRGPKPKSGLALVMRTQKLQQYQQQPPPGEERTDDDVDVEGGQKLPVVARKLSPAEGIRVPQLDQDMRDFFSDKVDGETREAVRFYFDYFYPLSPMFHPSMFIRRLVHGQVDPLLIDTIKATTARVITQKTGRVVDGKALAESVKARMLGQLENPTVDLVRTIVAMTLHAGSIGEHVSYNSLICLAASLVVRLGWHQLDLYRRPAPGSWDEWVSLEVKRRLFWLVYQIDSYQALLTGRPMSVAEDSVYVSAPCSDYEWDAMHINRRTIPGKGNESLSRSSSAQAQPQRSSRSSSGSGTSLPSLRVSANEIVATGAFSYSFMALCELTAILAQINSFLRDAKASRPSLLVTPLGSNGSAPFPAVDFMTAAGTSGNTGSLVYPILRTVSVLSEYPAFAEIDERLQEWHRSLLMPEDLRDDATEAGDISYFGTADHRRFMMRVRYFCLHCYYTPIAIFLHQSNRRSFFTEYEQPLEERLAKTRTKATNSPQAGQVPTEASMTSEDISAMESDRQLREMLNMAFASTWNEGLLAYDIEESSWKVCVQSSKDLSEHLRRNDDFPLDRFDQVIPFCIFMSVSVLIRQVRMCSRILSEQEEQKLEVMGGRAAVMAERAHCVEYIKHQWTTLQALSALWDVDGLEQLLKSMQLDEVTKAADMFSTMLL